MKGSMDMGNLRFDGDDMKLYENTMPHLNLI
jgi:hypothetical protein